MLQKPQQKLKLPSGETSAFYPICFNDPVATQTDWKPLKRGGAIRTHEFIRVSPSRSEFRANLSSRIVNHLLILTGAGFLTFAINEIITNGFSLEMKLLMTLLLGLYSAITGTYLDYYNTPSIIFDTQAGFFWKGKANPGSHFDRAGIRDLLPLDEIHALQLIDEYCRTSKSSFFSYELNLVTKNGQRINVADHCDLERIRKDTKALGDFIDKPIWDAIFIRRLSA